MKTSNDRNQVSESLRIRQLNHEIEKLYGHLDPEEIDLITSDFDEALTTMIELIEVNPLNSLAIDFFEDIEFKPVDFPGELLPLLRKSDVFLAKLGKRQGRWQVVYLSSVYEEECAEDWT